MTNRKIVGHMFLVFVFLLFVGMGSLWPTESLAYLDPATGSLLLQALIGAVGSALVAIGVFWRKIKSFFGIAPKRTEDDPTDPK